MLRHFETVNSELKDKFIGEGFSTEQIENELSLVGSKFDVEFATDISVLLNRCNQYSNKESIGENGNLIIECSVPKDDFPDGIGTQAVIPIQDIPESKRRFIFTQKNREVELLHYKVDDFPKTNLFTIILKPIKEKFLFISAFPGAPAMPIPIISMNLALYTSCKKYWDTHVFLIT